VITTENEKSLKQFTKKLIRAGKEIGLNINGEKKIPNTIQKTAHGMKIRNRRFFI